MNLRKLFIQNSSKWRILLVIAVPAAMLYALFMMLSPVPVTVNSGRADLSDVDFSSRKSVLLDGQWEFYWDRLLTPEDFSSGQSAEMDSLMPVPGVWSDGAGTRYSRQGLATYRLTLYYPSTLKDPALRIQNVATAYKLYANGQLITEVGTVSDNKTNFKEGEKTLILDLPKDTQEIALVFQVANLNYATGGLRAAPVFGSKQVLEQRKSILLVLQLLFIGGAFIFGLYYFLLFLLQTKNWTAVFFSILCFITALRSLIWGETPLVILFPNASFDLRMYINYLTGYNYVPIALLFIHSLYPSEFKKKITGVIVPVFIGTHTEPWVL